MSAFSVMARAAVVLMSLPFLAAAAPAPSSGDASAAPKFYAYCVEMGVPGVKQRPVAEQAKMLKQIGFDGGAFVIWLDEKTFAQNLKALDDAGLELPMLEVNISVGPKGPAYDARLPDLIRELKGRDTTICVTIGGLKPGDPAGMDTAVKALRELADVAAEAGCRISVYEHVGAWSESLPFVFDLVRKTNHPQVGANFNLCHYLKVHGDMDYRPLLRANAGKVFCVTLCGAEMGAKAWTHGLIQPLDEGNFDNRQLLAVLRETGYRGPIGLMCYGVPEKTEEHLARSLKVLQGWAGDWEKAGKDDKVTR